MLRQDRIGQNKKSPKYLNFSDFINRCSSDVVPLVLRGPG